MSLCAQPDRADLLRPRPRLDRRRHRAGQRCHPFSVGPYLFMHNDPDRRLLRRIENMIPDRFYGQRRGGTDSEAIFLIAMGDIDNEGPVEAVRLALARITAEMDQAGIGEALRFAARIERRALAQRVPLVQATTRTSVYRYCATALCR